MPPFSLRAHTSLISVILLFALLPLTLNAAQDGLPDYAGSMLDKLIDQKITVERYSGKKIKGTLRAVDSGYLQIEMKDNSISEVEITDVKKIKRSGGFFSGFGGVLTGICIGTGAFVIVLYGLVLLDRI